MYEGEGTYLFLKVAFLVLVAATIVTIIQWATTTWGEIVPDAVVAAGLRYASARPSAMR